MNDFKDEYQSAVQDMDMLGMKEIHIDAVSVMDEGRHRKCTRKRVQRVTATTFSVVCAMFLCGFGTVKAAEYIGNVIRVKEWGFESGDAATMAANGAGAGQAYVVRDEVELASGDGPAAIGDGQPELVAQMQEGRMAEAVPAADGPGTRALEDSGADGSGMGQMPSDSSDGGQISLGGTGAGQISSGGSDAGQVPSGGPNAGQVPSGSSDAGQLMSGGSDTGQMLSESSGMGQLPADFVAGQLVVGDGQQQKQSSGREVSAEGPSDTGRASEKKESGASSAESGAGTEMQLALEDSLEDSVEGIPVKNYVSWEEFQKSEDIIFPQPSIDIGSKITSTDITVCGDWAMVRYDADGKVLWMERTDYADTQGHASSKVFPGGVCNERSYTTPQGYTYTLIDSVNGAEDGALQIHAAVTVGSYEAFIDFMGYTEEDAKEIMDSIDLSVYE